ncbi:MAG: DUF1570 domain-containing protein [Phycisphaeraceae bacterium]|nr:DUF1570 domain-containing protein [Phycisphaeraceae bacterium]
MEVSRRTFIQSGVALAASWWLSRSVRGSPPDGLRAADGTPPPAAEGILAESTAPRDPRELDLLHARLPTFQASRRDTWVLLSDCDDPPVRAALELLEASERQVTRVSRELDFEPRDPGARHLGVLFRSFDQYRAFARAEAAHGDGSALGHYAPRERYSAFVALAPTQEFLELVRRLEQDPEVRVVRRSDRGGRRAHGASSAAQSKAMVAEAIDETRLRAARLISHEAAHQLLHERGVLPAHSGCPAWLGEGFACAFETERAIGDFGPDVDVAARRERLERALEEGAAMPLGALVGMTGRPTPGTRASLDWYAQSWSLVTWLYREQRQGLVELMSSVREGTMPASPKGRIALFESACGPLSHVEPAWREAWCRRDDDRPHATRARPPAARTST